MNEPLLNAGSSRRVAIVGADRRTKSASQAVVEIGADLARAKQQLGRTKRRNEELEAENERLRRQLSGALYQIHGDWTAVNREMAA